MQSFVDVTCDEIKPGAYQYDSGQHMPSYLITLQQHAEKNTRDSRDKVEASNHAGGISFH